MFGKRQIKLEMIELAAIRPVIVLLYVQKLWKVQTRDKELELVLIFEYACVFDSSLVNASGRQDQRAPT